MGSAIMLKDHKIKSGPSPLKPKLTVIGSSAAQEKLISGVFYGLKKFTRARSEGHQGAEDSLRMVVYLSTWDPTEYFIEVLAPCQNLLICAAISGCIAKERKMFHISMMKNLHRYGNNLNV
ncbi:hypothetical protein QQP08_021045 [Theobroma cacao]|nr:hypothetical protein QQP08_021045 [Theobroma cacao]